MVAFWSQLRVANLKYTGQQTSSNGIPYDLNLRIKPLKTFDSSFRIHCSEGVGVTV